MSMEVAQVRNKQERRGLLEKNHDLSCILWVTILQAKQTDLSYQRTKKESYKVTKLKAPKITMGTDCVCVSIMHLLVSFYESVFSLESVRAGWIAEELVLQRLGSDKLPGLRSMI